MDPTGQLTEEGNSYVADMRGSGAPESVVDSVIGTWSQTGNTGMYGEGCQGHSDAGSASVPSGRINGNEGGQPKPEPLLASPTIIPPFKPGWDPKTPPGPGWKQIGPKGNWWNPETGEWLSPDEPHGPYGKHVDWGKRGEEGKTRLDPKTGQPLPGEKVPDWAPRPDPSTDMPTLPDPETPKTDYSTLNVDTWGRIGMIALGVGIITFDFFTVPSGEGLFGVGLIGRALGVY